jgi:hypothetical protein
MTVQQTIEARITVVQSEIDDLTRITQNLPIHESWQQTWARIIKRKDRCHALCDDLVWLHGLRRLADTDVVIAYIDRLASSDGSGG